MVSKVDSDCCAPVADCCAAAAAGRGRLRLRVGWEGTADIQWRAIQWLITEVIASGIIPDAMVCSVVALSHLQLSLGGG